mmetsp:Transcript_31864/g.82537  ORF Transcript_31864/g.82537 Transcript_31864/m.82537 type:complete len:277 (+) Transcript_31864:178-1008(+)
MAVVEVVRGGGLVEHGDEDGDHGRGHGALEDHVDGLHHTPRLRGRHRVGVVVRGGVHQDLPDPDESKGDEHQERAHVTLVDPVGNRLSAHLVLLAPRAGGAVGLLPDLAQAHECASVHRAPAGGAHAGPGRGGGSEVCGGEVPVRGADVAGAADDLQQRRRRHSQSRKPKPSHQLLRVRRIIPQTPLDPREHELLEDRDANDDGQAVPEVEDGAAEGQGPDVQVHLAGLDQEGPQHHRIRKVKHSIRQQHHRDALEGHLHVVLAHPRLPHQVLGQV